MSSVTVERHQLQQQLMKQVRASYYLKLLVIHSYLEIHKVVNLSIARGLNTLIALRIAKFHLI